MALQSQKKLLEILYKDSFARYSIREFILAKDVVQDIFLIPEGKKNYLGFALNLSPVIYAGEDLVKAFNDTIKLLDEGSVIQSISLSLPSIGGEIDQWREGRMTDDATSLVTSGRSNLLKESVLNKKLNGDLQLRDKHNLLFIKIPTKDVASLEPIKRKMDEIISMLGVVNARKMTEQEVCGVFWKIMNIHKFIENPSILSEINSVHLDTIFSRDSTLKLYKESLIQEDGKSSIQINPLTVSEYPNHLTPDNIGQLMGDVKDIRGGISLPFVIYTNIIVGNPITDINSYIARKLWIGKQIGEKSSLVEAYMPNLMQWFRDLNEYIEVVNGDRLIPCRMYSGINLYTKPNDKVDEVQPVVSKFSRAGFRLERERHIPLPVYLNSLPFNYQSLIDNGSKKTLLKRSMPVHSWNASSAMMVQGGSIRTHPQDGGVPFLSRQGAFSPFNLFAIKGAKNFTILGSTGSGKSFMANDFVASAYADNAYIFIFDSGGSYSGFTSFVQGNSIRFRPDKPLSINPFYGYKTEKAFVEAQEFLEKVLCIMLNYRGDSDQVESVMASKVIRDAWDRKKEDLSAIDIFDQYSILETEKPELKEQIGFWKTVLYDYVDEKGKYFVYFNGKPQINLNHRFNYLELDDLSENKMLRTLVLSIMSSHILKLMYQKSRKIPKLVIFDEAWELLRDPIVAPVIESMYRKMRKYGGATGLISQSFKDVDPDDPEKKVMSVAYDNSQYRFYLRQELDSIESAKEKHFLGKEDQPYEILKSFPQASQAKFSEVLLQTGGFIVALRYYTDRLSYLAYSSDAEDVEMIEDYCKKHHCDKATAIVEMVQQERKNGGVA